MKLKLLILLIVSLAVIALPVSAFMEPSHMYMIKTICDDSSVQGKFKSECCAEELYCMAGAMSPDIGIPDYFSDRGQNKLLGKNYKDLHSPLFCSEMYNIALTAKEKAFAIGCAGGHLYPDSYSHNFFVPAYLKRVNQPNSIGHVWAELALDNRFSNKELIDLSREAAALMPEMVPLMERVLENTALSNYDQKTLKSRVDFYVVQITGGGDLNNFKLGWQTMTALPWHILLLLFMGFGLSIYGIIWAIRAKWDKRLWKRILYWMVLMSSLIGATLLGLLFYGLLSGQLWNIFLFLSKILTPFIPVGDPQAVMGNAYTYTKQFFTSAAPYELLKNPLNDPSGDTSLYLAERGFRSISVILTVIAVAVITLLVYFKILKKKKK